MAHAKGYNFLKWLACFPNTTSVQTFVTIRKELKKIFYIEADEILLAVDNDTRKSVWISYNKTWYDSYEDCTEYFVSEKDTKIAYSKKILLSSE
jgi:hypothetical protein